MRAIPNQNLATRSAVSRPLLLLCALIFYYFAVLKTNYLKTELPDVGPHPDALEYFAQARSILKGEWPSTQIGYDKLPSRSPPRYPALMPVSWKIPSQR